VDAAEWTSWSDVQRTFPSTDLVGRLGVFNIGGNKLPGDRAHRIQVAQSLHPTRVDAFGVQQRGLEA
jgi:hypothetical protein